MKVLLLGKDGDSYCAQAAATLQSHVDEVDVHLFKRGAKWSTEVGEWRGDFIMSYLCPLIVPQDLLDHAEIAAINFHPGPPQYPGVGCTNFAVYNEETEFGVTCHHMAAQVDTGSIIAVRRFPLFPNDSVYALTQRCYAHIFTLFCDILGVVLEGEQLPQSEEVWTRAPYKRSELDELCRITPDMSAAEAERRIRAVSFPGAPGAFVEIHGHRFLVDDRG